MCKYFIYSEHGVAFFHTDLQLDLKCHKLVLFSGLSVSLLVVSQSLCWSDPTEQASEKTQTQIPMISANLSPPRDIPQQDKSLGLGWSLCSQIGLAGLNLVTCRLLVRAGERLEPLQSPRMLHGRQEPSPIEGVRRVAPSDISLSCLRRAFHRNHSFIFFISPRAAGRGFIWSIVTILKAGKVAHTFNISTQGTEWIPGWFVYIMSFMLARAM